MTAAHLLSFGPRDALAVLRARSLQAGGVHAGEPDFFGLGIPAHLAAQASLLSGSPRGVLPPIAQENDLDALLAA
jgi:hypothetical protein